MLYSAFLALYYNNFWFDITEDYIKIQLKISLSFCLVFADCLGFLRTVYWIFYFR